MNTGLAQQGHRRSGYCPKRTVIPLTNVSECAVIFNRYGFIDSSCFCVAFVNRCSSFMPAVSHKYSQESAALLSTLLFM